MRYLNRILFALTIPAILFLGSCGDDDGANIDNFDRKAMLENISQNIILPAFANFETETTDLKDAITTLANDVNAANLDNAQQAWLNAALSWSYAEMFMMGPIDQMVVAYSIQNWPASPANIEEGINTTETINEAYIESIGSSKKGLPAIEYLLFDFDNGDQVILDQLLDSENRRAYLEALAQNLNTIATNLYQGWKPDGGNYISTFTSSTGKDAASSANVLANEFLMLIEDVRRSKIGVPLGKSSMGTILPEMVEARFSGESLKLMLRNLDAIEDVFLGTGTNGDQLGYYDYLNALNAEYQGMPLADVIADQMSTFRAAINGINDPLKTAVLNQTEAVEQAFTEGQKLVVLTKTDMISRLGLSVTYVDNDGD